MLAPVIYRNSMPILTYLKNKQWLIEQTNNPNMMPFVEVGCVCTSQACEFPFYSTKSINVFHSREYLDDSSLLHHQVQAPSIELVEFCRWTYELHV